MNHDDKTKVSAQMTTRLTTKMTALCSLALYALCAFCGCQEWILPPPDELEIPETLRVPPLEQKQRALQAILDGVLESIKFRDELCDFEPITDNISDVRCVYPDGGVVSWKGERATELRQRSVLNRQLEGEYSEVKLHEIQLEDYRFMAHVGQQRVSTPQTCREEVVINGTGSFYGEVGTSEMMGKQFLLNAGGVFRGVFNVVLRGETFQISIPIPGFYYHRDITPLLINAPGDEPGDRPTVQILQVSLITSGNVKINQQAYSYQDVYLETFSSDDFWDAECRMRMRQ